MSSDINVQTFSGKVNITSNLLVGSSHLFVDTNNNRVGLVTTDPHAGLHVNSNAYVNTDLRVGPTGPNQVVINATAGRIKAASFEGDGSAMTGINSDSGSWVNGTNSNVHLATSTDKVGIGTVSPATYLHLSAKNSNPGATEGDSVGTHDLTEYLRFTSTFDGGDVNAVSVGFKLGADDNSSVTPDGRLDICANDGAVAGNSYGATPDRTIATFLGSGNVGVGTDNPQTLLEIVKAGDPTLRIRDSDIDGKARIQLLETGGYTDGIPRYGTEISYDGDNNKFHISTYDGSTTKRDDLTIVRSTGNVGIGKLDPLDKLQTNIIRIGDWNGGGNGFRFSMDTNASLRIQYMNGSTVHSNIMSLKYDNGNVGIGESSPDEKLHVAGNVHVRGSTRFDVKTDVSNHVIAGNWYSSSHSLSLVSAGSININMDYNANDTGKVIDFRTNTSTNGGTLLMRIKEGGGVLIGDQAPYGSVTYTDAQLALGGTHNQGYNRSNYIKLLISGGNNDSGSPYYIMCEDENGHDQFYIKGQETDGEAWGGELYIKGKISFGRAYAGTAYYTYAFIPGNWMRLQGGSSGQGNMYGSYTSLAVGNFWAAGSTRFSSDDRIKHFEEEIPNALELIQQLKPYKYKKTSKIYDEDYTGDIGEDWEWEIGLIAQDVEKIPYLEHTVSKPEDNPSDMYGLNYTQFIGVCIQGIKDMDKELQTTKSELQSEKEKVRNLESKTNETNETIETIKTQLEVEKIKNSELQKKLELLEMSQMALVSRLEAIENM